MHSRALVGNIFYDYENLEAESLEVVRKYPMTMLCCDVLYDMV